MRELIGRWARGMARALVPLVMGAVLVDCATESKPAQPKRAYENAELGVRAELPDRWRLFASRDEAPPDLAPLFPVEKGRNAPPLLIAERADRLAYARMLVETTDQDAVGYLDLLLSTYDGQLAVLEAAHLPGSDAVRWVYRVSQPSGDIAFVEYVIVVRGLAYRVGFWTLESRLPRLEPGFDALAARFRFLSGSAWRSPFAGAATALEPIAHVPLAGARRESAPLRCPEGRSSLLWRVGEGASVAHLFGSIHFGQADFYPLPEGVQAAFSEADRLVVELDIDRMESAAAERIMATRGTLPPGQRLADVLGAPTHARLAQALAELGIPVEAVERQRPFVVAMTLSSLKLQSMGYLPDDGVDRYFLDRRGERPLVELESLESQLELLERLDSSLYLDYTLESLDALGEEVHGLAEDWYCGREEALAARLLESEDEAMLPLLELIFHERNLAMAARIHALLEARGRSFVVVGAGHLVGERGIPALLAERGLSVERLE